MIFPYREMQRSSAIVARIVNIRAVFEEKKRDLQISPHGCSVQWCEMITANGIYVLRVTHNQPFHHVTEAAQCRIVQRGCCGLRGGVPWTVGAPLLINVPY